MYDIWLVATTAACVIGALIVHFCRQYRKLRREENSAKLIEFQHVDCRTRIFYPFVNPKGVMNLRSLRAEMDSGINWLDVREHA